LASAPAASSAPVAIDPGSGIIAVVAYDPDGDDGQENNGQAPLVLDGNPDTGWSTSCYSSEYLGGKAGVGVVASLGSVQAGRLTVSVASAPWILEVYGSSADAIPTTYPGWGPPLSSNNGTAAKTVELQVTTPVHHLLVSLHQLGRGASCSSDNPFSGTIAEVQFEPLS
jgi:hypothetical protein